MAMCEHGKEKPGMECPSKEVAKKFAKTKEKGLPNKVKKHR